MHVSVSDADECGIGYQYRSPPELMSCRPNVSITRLDCLVALPTPPDNTRVDIRWYWRSLQDGEGGSSVAFEVENLPPFRYARVLCDRDCPTPLNNLTVHVNQLGIRSFDSTLQGDYMCRVLVINETTGRVEQALQPSACTRLQIESNQAQNCHTMGHRDTWKCADTNQCLECPQEFSVQPVTSDEISSSIFSEQLQSTYTIYATSTSLHTPTISAYSTHPSTVTVTPTSITPNIQDGQQDEIATYIYVPIVVLTLFLMAGIGFALFVLLGLQKRKKGSSLRVLQKGKFFMAMHLCMHIYIIFCLDGVLSDVLKEESRSVKSASLQRNSTIYAKPIWPNNEHGKDSNVKDHQYATIPGEEERASDVGAYSYAYQHHMCPQMLAESKGTTKTGGAYTEFGTADYLHMYSKPSPLLVGHSGPIVTTQSLSIEERGYKQLESTTLNTANIYTKPVPTPV